MPLSQSQKKYAMERIQAILNDKMAKIEVETKRKPDLSPQQKCDAILLGTAELQIEKIVPTGRYQELPSIGDVYTFPAQDEIDAWNKDALESAESRRAKLRAAASALRDQVMLGDPPDGLKAISQFASKKF